MTHKLCLHLYDSMTLLVMICFMVSGFFGFFTLSILLVPFYYIKAGPGSSFIFKDPDTRIENAIDAFYQMGSNWQIIVAQVGEMSFVLLTLDV